MIFQWIGMPEYIPCHDGPAEHWGLLPATRLASRIILIEQNIKKRTGPALCVLCGYTTPVYISPVADSQCMETCTHSPHPRHISSRREYFCIVVGGGCTGPGEIPIEATGGGPRKSPGCHRMCTGALVCAAAAGGGGLGTTVYTTTGRGGSQRF